MPELEVPLFFHPEYLRIVGNTAPLFTYKMGTQAIHFQLKGKEAISLWKAPFGGITPLSASITEDFLQSMEHFVKEEGAMEVAIKWPPFPYDAQLREKKAIFRLQGYEEEVEMSHWLRLDEKMEGRLHGMEKRKWRKGEENGWQYSEALDVQQFYAFVARVYNAMDYEMSVTEETLEQLANAFPDRYRFCQVLNNQGESMAVCCRIQVTADIAYYFLPATDPAYKSESPSVFLIMKMAARLKGQEMKWLDMGTSMNGESINHSLARFKEHMGAMPYPKITFTKDLIHV